MRKKCWKRWSFVSEGQQLLTLVELQSLLLAVCVCVCVCVREREREQDSDRVQELTNNSRLYQLEQYHQDLCIDQKRDKQSTANTHNKQLHV